MPRKNNKKHPDFKPFAINLPKNKRRYSSRREAEEVAEYQMALNPGLELFVYKDIDGGWYLTRQAD